MTKIEDILTQLAASLARRTDVKNAMDLFQHGEWHVGFEILSDNVYEEDVEVSDSEVRLARMAAKFWQDSPSYYVAAVEAAETLASSGPRGEDGRHRRRILTLKNCSQTPDALHAALATALDFPDFYGNNWDAFWDAITGLVAMPHCLVLWDWDVLSAGSPENAFELLRCLSQAQEEMPDTSATVELWDGMLNVISPTSELVKLAGQCGRK